MKIENIGQIKEVEQIQIISEYTAPKFAEGQILIAQVEHMEGDKVMLKNDQGRFFMALMQNDLGISEGDIVEVAANSNGSGYVLHLLDVSANMQNEKLAADRYMIPGTLATMKANPGLDPKAASFLIENNIPRTPENIAALARIIHGGSDLGALLAGILSGLEEAGLTAQAGAATGMPAYTGGASVVQGNAEAGNTAGKIMAQADAVMQQINDEPVQPNVSGQTAAAAGQVPVSGVPIQNAAGQQANITGYGAADAAQAHNAAETVTAAQGQPTMGQPTAGAAAAMQGQDTAVNASAAPNAQNMANVSQETVSHAAPQVILNGDIYVMKENAAEGKTTAPTFGEPLAGTTVENAANETAGTDNTVSRLLYKEEIADRIRAMFCRPDKQTGAEFKKTILDIPDALSALKLLLHQSDKQDKGELAQKAGQAQRQVELLAESKRFDCIQVPFMLKNGAEKTAELYVYRHKRGQKEPGEEGLSVLIALDTQYIGRIETLMKTSGKSLSLEFRLERKDIQPEIIKRSKGLAKSLENAGYTLKSLKITGLETKTTVLNAAGVLIPDAGVSPGNIDVQI